MLIDENKLHNDIVQENFLDTYKNLTLKTIMGLKWVSDYCGNASYAMKIDDDVVVNPFFLLKYLGNNVKKSVYIKNKIIGKYNDKPKVRRTKTSKFFIPYSEFKAKRFDEYCDGPAYLISKDLVRPLYEKSLHVKKFLFEDVYMGMLGKRLKVDYIKLNKMYLYNKKYMAKFAYLPPKYLNKFLFVYTRNANSFEIIWKKIYNLNLKLNHYNRTFFA